eukprot:SAG11_NODE_1925_length_4056_cov_3.841547_2_plen_171_part_00
MTGADAADKADDEEDSAASPTSVRVPAVDTESLMRPTPRMAARATRRRPRSTDDSSDDEDDSTPSRSARQRKVQRTVLQGLREDLLRKVTDTAASMTTEDLHKHMTSIQAIDTLTKSKAETSRNTRFKVADIPTSLRDSLDLRGRNFKTFLEEFENFLDTQHYSRSDKLL